MAERIGLTAVGVAQGLAVWLLAEHWPEGDPAALASFTALLTFLAVSGGVFHFAWNGHATGRLVLFASGVGIIYAAMAGWIGWQLPRGGETFFGDSTRVGSWVLTSLATLYVLTPFVQIVHAEGRTRFPWDEVHRRGWSNFFIGLVGGVFVGVLWVVLVLWARLFDLVGIEFFEDLFSEEAFVFGVTGGAVGLGLAVARESERVIGTLRGLIEALGRAFLPLTSFVALLLLLFLPFAGLEPLRETDRGAHILLSWMALTILLINTVGPGRPKPARPLRWLIEAGLLAMLVFGGIALHGLYVRIDQHGLTPGRWWGMLFALFFTACAFGYAAVVLLRRGPWLDVVARVNPVLAGGFVAIGLLTHTPLLDPLAWSARNQFTRLVDGEVDAEAFDYAFLRFRLGRVGDERLKALEALDHPQAAAIRRGVARADVFAYYHEALELPGPAFAPGDITLLPAGSEWPDGLLDAIRVASNVVVQGECRRNGQCVVFPVELDETEGPEYVAVLGNWGYGPLFAFARDGSGWRKLGRFETTEGPPIRGSLVDVLRAGQFESVPPSYRDLIIDEQRYQLRNP